MANPLYDTLFGRHAGKTTAFLHLEGGVTLTHAGFLGRAARFAHVLTGLGLKPGDRLAVQIDKSPDALALYAACVQAGLVFLPLNPGYTAAEVDYFVTNSGAGLLVCDPVRHESLTPVAAKADARLETMDATGQGSLRQLASTQSASFKTVERMPDDLAALLYTSGTTGRSKGAMLSQNNLLNNAETLTAQWQFTDKDVLLHALPIFHSFGLTGGTLLPILHGVRTVLYPSPLHYRIVPAMAYASNATIIFGTDTFLAGYARMAHSYDFYSLRYIFAGAERVKDETRQAYADKFGLRILEGYGATEASPVIAVNTPMHYRPGTVGRLLPGMEARMEDVEGIDQGGRAFVRGPNIMAGYLKADKPGVLQPPKDGWHDTGDIVEIDDEGFVTIQGRVKRFTKIGGEMVSLPAVEGYVNAVWPDGLNAVVSRPDARKGEQLVLFTTEKHAKLAALRAWGKENGVAELAIPKDIRIVDELPLLGTGKVDYATLNTMAAE